MALATNGAPRNHASGRACPSWSTNRPVIDVSGASPGSGPSPAAFSSPPLEDANPALPCSTPCGSVTRPLVITRSTRNSAAATISTTRIVCERFMRTAGRSVELHLRVGRHLLQPDAASLDVGLRVVLALHLVAREPAQHRQLAGVRERVGDAALEHAPHLPLDRLAGGEVGVCSADGAEEARDLGVPG